MGAWHRAGKLEDIWEGAPLAVELAGKPIALYRFGEDICAVGDICPHQADVKLSDGYLDGDTIECPMHQSCFNVRTGHVLSPPAREDIPVFAIRIEDGQVMVEIGD